MYALKLLLKKETAVLFIIIFVALIGVHTVLEVNENGVPSLSMGDVVTYLIAAFVLTAAAVLWFEAFSWAKNNRQE